MEGGRKRETKRNSSINGAHAQKGDVQKEGPILFSETLEAV